MVTLFGYQKDVVNKVLAHLKTSTQALIVMATGLGKTIIMAAILARLIEEKRFRVLFLCHETGILDQARREFRRVLSSAVTYGTYHGARKDNSNADIIFASFQTMLKHKEQFGTDAFDAVLVDESHHGQAPTFKEVIEYFTPNDFLLGVTATPDREDEKNIRAIFGEEVVSISLPEGIANGWLTPVEYHLVTDNLNVETLREIAADVLEQNKRLSLKQINERLFIEARDEQVAAQILRHDTKGIIFCENIRHAEHFSQYLPNSETCHSGKRWKENADTLKALKSGELQYVLVVDKFNEGIDVPDVELITFLRCTASKRIFMQQLGRGLRIAQGKHKVVVLDFVANCDRILQVKGIIDAIEGFGTEDKTPFTVSGRGYDFFFSAEQVQILEVIDRLTQGFYPTWQEASDATRALRIRTLKEYLSRYKEDPRLPGHLSTFYSDFPGWRVFRFGESHRRYETWEEASAAARKLGIRTEPAYFGHYKRDPKLPSDPHRRYADFPGWTVFLESSRIRRATSEGSYSTWQEAGRAANALGIRTSKEYRSNYGRDARLVGDPPHRYADFPGWAMFLRGEQKIREPREIEKYYTTWEEASTAARKLKLRSGTEYRKGYKQDPRLPSDPRNFYSGSFPGWPIFLRD